MNFFGYYILNLNPTILAFNGLPFPTPDWLKPRALIQHVPWWHGTFNTMARRKLEQLRHVRAGIDHSLIVNAEDEDAKRRLFRMKGALISQNIYVNENVYKPKPVAKRFDAIYIAQLKRFKRHQLARDVNRLLIVAGELHDRAKFQPLVPHAIFNETRLTRDEVADAINAASCSLALSKIEGAMLASFESLLCGIPVVSTVSKGGRDVFFDERNSAVVPADPVAVAAAVKKFQTHPPDALELRATALAKLEPHRMAFCTYVSELSSRLGGLEVDPRARYAKYFGPNGLADCFIFADKLEVPAEVARAKAATFHG